MAPAASSLSRSFIAILLLQMAILTSEQFTVRSSTSHQVATVGSQAEFSCQLSPPQSALHMKVGWFRNQSSQLVYLHVNGEEHSGESTQNYGNRTVVLKNTLGEGKISLRIYNTSIFDAGLYNCFFQDGDIYEEATVDLRVAATGNDIRIKVRVPDTEGLLVECESEEWFPQAEMMWTDSQGHTIPHSSKYYSQDGSGLLHLRTSILLKNNTPGPVTCSFYNIDTGQKKRAGIFIPDILFEPKYMFLPFETAPLVIYVIIAIIVIIVYAPKCCGTTEQTRRVQQSRRSCLRIVLQSLPFLMHMAFFPVYLSFRSRVSISDDRYTLYYGWMWDLCKMLTSLMAFFTVTILVLLHGFKICGYEMNPLI